MLHHKEKALTLDLGTRNTKHYQEKVGGKHQELASKAC